MGIRFLCPNGHKLNVKSDLAGKRAICPTCGAKLVVPTASGGMAEASASSSKDFLPATPSGVGLEGKPPHPSAEIHREQPPQAGAWFVRPTSGGQFGPASDEVFATWIREGRITASAHVWRDGWPQWRLVRDVADALPVPLTAAVPPSDVPPVAKFAEPAAAEPAAEELAALPQWNDEAALPASRYRASRLRKNKLQRTLAVLMLVAVLVLTVILLWVLLGRRESTQGRLPSGPGATHRILSEGSAI